MTLTETLTPSELRQHEEQQERNERILVELDKPQCSLELHFPDEAHSAGFVLVGLKSALGELNDQGLLRRNGDIECVQQWLHTKAVEFIREHDTQDET